MGKMNKALLTVLCVAIVGISATVAVLYNRKGQPESNASDVATLENGKQNRPKATANRPKSRRRVRDGKSVRSESSQEAAREKPKFDLADEEEAELNEAQKQLLNAIREALDEDDGKRVMKLVRQLQESKEWPDGVPKSIKIAAISALGWFGSSALPEIAGFLADADADVSQAAIDRYEEMLADFDLSDYERADILVMASQVVTDPDEMDIMMMNLTGMRNSVAIDAIKRMMVQGNEATKSVLPDNIEFFTGEEDVKTAKQLDEWLEQNPDGEDDDDYYGGAKKQ